MYMQGVGEKSTSGSIGDQEKENKTTGKENEKSQPSTSPPAVSVYIWLQGRI